MLRHRPNALKAGLLSLLLLVIAPANAGYHDEDPADVLEAYLNILESRDFGGIADMMEAQDMADLKTLMDGAIKSQAKNGNYGLMQRVFGKRVKLTKVDATEPDVYLKRLAREILNAADQQHFLVKSVSVIGHVDETQEMVHYVARLTLEQGGQETSDIYTYTLVWQDDAWKLKFPPTIRQLLLVIETSIAAQR